MAEFVFFAAAAGAGVVAAHFFTAGGWSGGAGFGVARGAYRGLSHRRNGCFGLPLLNPDVEDGTRHLLADGIQQRLALPVSLIFISVNGADLPQSLPAGLEAHVLHRRQVLYPEPVDYLEH